MLHHTTPTRILFVSALFNPDVVSEALRLSAGYVHKPSVQSDLVSAIETVLRGERFANKDLEIGEKTDKQGRDDKSCKFS